MNACPVRLKGGRLCNEPTEPYITAHVGHCRHGLIAHGCQHNVKQRVDKGHEFQPIWRCKKHRPRKETTFDGKPKSHTR